MAARTCFAQADTPRAVLALAVPPAVFAYVAFTLWSRGYTLFGYFALMQSGELGWLGQGIGWVALLIWIVRYYPPAWSAIWDGPCLVSGDEAEVVLPGGRRLNRAEISAVRLERGWLRKAAHFETSTGRISLPLIFVRPSSDHWLQSLKLRGAGIGVPGKPVEKPEQ